MRIRLPAEEKLLLVKRVQSGERISNIAREARVSRKTLYQWVKSYQTARTRAKRSSLVAKNPKGKGHWRSIDRTKEKAILKSVIKDSKISIRSLSQKFELSIHCIWNVLDRNNIRTIDERKNFISSNTVKILHEKTTLQKKDMVERVASGHKVSAVCKEFGVSRKTFYKWYKRYQDGHKTMEGLTTQRQKGQKHWRYNSNAANLITQIVSMYPQYTAVSISNEIFQMTGKRMIGSHGVYNTLKRMDLTTYRHRLAYAAQQKPQQKRATISVEVHIPGIHVSFPKKKFMPVLVLMLSVLLIFIPLHTHYDYPISKKKSKVVLFTLSLSQKQTNAKPIEAQSVYIVQRGDNLWKIAQKMYQSGYKWTDIAHQNRLNNPGILVIGQELTIPITNEKEEVLSYNIVNKNMIVYKFKSYIVQKNDSLWSIAISIYNNGYRWVDIKKANAITDPGLIYPGTTLKIPE